MPGLPTTVVTFGPVGRCRLTRDGVEVAPTLAPRAVHVSGPFHVVVRAWTQARELLAGAPKWSWPFILGCLALPLATLGGAVPVLVGTLTAAGCAELARRSTLSPKLRVGANVALLAVCAVTFAGVRAVHRALPTGTAAGVALGASCTSDGATTCANDGDTRARCEGGAWHLDFRCRGPGRCGQSSVDSAWCDARRAEVGDPCDERRFAGPVCADDRLLGCKAGKLQVTRRCAKTCRSSGGDGWLGTCD